MRTFGVVSLGLLAVSVIGKPALAQESLLIHFTDEELQTIVSEETDASILEGQRLLDEVAKKYNTAFEERTKERTRSPRFLNIGVGATTTYENGSESGSHSAAKITIRGAGLSQARTGDDGDFLFFDGATVDASLSTMVREMEDAAETSNEKLDGVSERIRQRIEKELRGRMPNQDDEAVSLSFRYLDKVEPQFKNKIEEATQGFKNFAKSSKEAYDARIAKESKSQYSLSMPLLIVDGQASVLIAGKSNDGVTTGADGALRIGLGRDSLEFGENGCDVYFLGHFTLEGKIRGNLDADGSGRVAIGPEAGLFCQVGNVVSFMAGATSELAKAKTQRASGDSAASGLFNVGGRARVVVDDIAFLRLEASHAPTPQGEDSTDAAWSLTSVNGTLHLALDEKWSAGGDMNYFRYTDANSEMTGNAKVSGWSAGLSAIRSF